MSIGLVTTSSATCVASACARRTGPDSLWQLVPLSLLSYGFGFGMSSKARTVFASGALLLVAAAYAIERLPLRLTVWRLTSSRPAVLGAWLLATVRLHTNERSSSSAMNSSSYCWLPVSCHSPSSRTTHRERQFARRSLLIALVPTVVVRDYSIRFSVRMPSSRSQTRQ